MIKTFVIPTIKSTHEDVLNPADIEPIKISLLDWIAESEALIHERLEATGADRFFITLAQEMRVYATSDDPDKKIYHED